MPDVPIEDQIRQQEAKIAEHKTTLDELGKRFVDTANRTLPGMFQEWIDREVKSHPDEIAKLGVERIAAAKKDIAAFIAKIPAEIDRLLPPPENWWHHRPLPDSAFKTDPHEKTNHPEFLGTARGVQEEFRSMATPMGAILMRYNIIRIGQDTGWDGWPGGPTYKYAFSWPKPLEDASKQYVDEYKKMISSNSHLNFLIGQKKQKDAKNLWDSV